MPPAARRGSPLDSRPALSRGRRDRTPCWVPLQVACGANVAGGNASPPRPGSTTMTGVTPLAEQWDAIVSEQPGDWSQLRVELRLADASTTERACVVTAPLNPWRRDDDFRIGILRFQAASSFGYGSFAGPVPMRPAPPHGGGIGGGRGVRGRAPGGGA